MKVRKWCLLSEAAVLPLVSKVVGVDCIASVSSEECSGMRCACLSSAKAYKALLSRCRTCNIAVHVVLVAAKKELFKLERGLEIEVRTWFFPGCSVAPCDTDCRGSADFLRTCCLKHAAWKLVRGMHVFHQQRSCAFFLPQASLVAKFCLQDAQLAMGVHAVLLIALLRCVCFKK
jgi:hypothetical protein